jgi:hypothetical protein
MNIFKKNRQTAGRIHERLRKNLPASYYMLSTEKGIALVMILILAAIALAIIAGLIYMITSSTQISGMQKRYRTALEAGMGGVDVTYQLIAARGNPYIPNINFSQSISDACLIAKLNTTTSLANWGTSCDLTKATSMSITPGDTSTYDFTFDIGSAPYPTYRGYAKIVNTVEGNSGGDEGLIGKGVVSSGSGEIAVMSMPYLYTIEVDTQNTSNPNERAKLSVLYQY